MATILIIVLLILLLGGGGGTLVLGGGGGTLLLSGGVASDSGSGVCVMRPHYCDTGPQRENPRTVSPMPSRGPDRCPPPSLRRA